MNPLNVLTATALATALVAAPAGAGTAHAAPVAAPAAAVAAPHLTSIWNFRDVAGDGVALSDGATMTTGVVYRAGQLNTLSSEEAQVLAGLGITDVVDLRSPTAAKNTPDAAVAGATPHLVNVFAGHNTSFKGKTAAGARAYMRAMNRAFVTDSAQRKKIAQAIRLIAAAKGPVLVHCAAGKDRTGWVSAMLMKIAGAKRATIVQQYLLSNTYRAQLIKDRVDAARASSGARRAAVVTELEKVRASFLDAGLDKAISKYGSLRGYLTKGLKLSSATIETLRTRLRTTA